MYVTDASLKEPYPSPMSGQPDLNLRIVVQFIAESAGNPSQYRLIAYSNARSFPALAFSTAAELVQRLEAAGIPAELRSQLDGETPNESKIVYSADFVLSDIQLRVLGLIS